MSARSTMCTELTQLSEEVYAWAHEQPGVGEESITDWLLYQVSQRIPFVHYHKFTRHEEARSSGADWDWWFVDSTQALGLRVQAKRLRPGQDAYKGLIHSNTHGLQIDLLRESARADRLVALDSFYQSELGVHAGVCPYSRMTAPHGVFLSAAGKVGEMLFAGGRPKVFASDVKRIGNPLPCVACCPLAGRGESPVDGIYSHLRRYFPGEFAEGDEIGLHGFAPTYVASLIDGQREELGDLWEEEYAQSMPGSRATLVVDLRGNGER